uniref:Sec2p domain-containing protein n=1 Tax=Parastrongyloides trichosuri TaxID=131310 RepID=A0A0N4ZHX4_PARTI
MMDENTSSSDNDIIELKSSSDDSDASSRSFMEKLTQLEADLKMAYDLLKEKDSKCKHLEELQKNVDSEVQELTEQLFQEAYRMVNDAEEKRLKAEILLEQSQLKVTTLSNEVDALKSIIKSLQDNKTSKLIQRQKNLFMSTSTSSPALSACTATAENDHSHVIHIIDPTYHRDFIQWRSQGMLMDEKCQFLKTIINEDINPCLFFENPDMSEMIYKAIVANTIDIELVSDENEIIRQCAFLKVQLPCPFRIRLNSEEDWKFISVLARNRVAAVCDFFTYLRYLIQGIVKTNISSSYKEIIHLRKNMMMARLGLQFESQIMNSSNNNSRGNGKECNVSYV